MSAPANMFDQAPLRPIRQLRNTRGLFRFLLRKAQLPLSLTKAVVKGAKYAWNPSQVSVRRNAAEKIAASAEAAKLKDDGYVLFDAQRFQGTEEALRLCRLMYEQSDMVHRELESHKKSFLVTLLENEDFLEWPDVFRFVSSRDLIDIASGYFGSVPLLSNVSLWWTPPNASQVQSQLFHCDREDSAVLKMFFNVHDVSDAMGPFCLIPADVSDRLKSAIGYEKQKSSRVTDEEIQAHGGLEHQIVLKGPQQTGACVDTYRCLHYGSRGNSQSRLVLMVRFSDYLAPYANIPNWYGGLRNKEYALDEVQKLALGLRT